MAADLAMVPVAARTSSQENLFPGSRCQALAILEGEAIAEPLVDFYRRAVDHLLLVRGQLKSGEVYGGVPDPQDPLNRALGGLEAVA
jgi:hypothetical protein